MIRPVVSTVRVGFIDAIMARIVAIVTDGNKDDALKVAEVMVVLSVLDITFFDAPAAVPMATKQLCQVGLDHPLLADCIVPTVLRLIAYQRELTGIFCLSTSALYVPPWYVPGSDLAA